MERPPDKYFGYGLPESDGGIEPSIRPICKRINESGWLWTVESCEGHGPDNPTNNWGDDRPMIRFLCATDHIGWLLLLLDKAVDYKITVPEIYLGYECDEQYSDILTYLRSSAHGVPPVETIHQRRGVYAALSELACKNPPTTLSRLEAMEGRLNDVAGLEKTIALSFAPRDGKGTVTGVDEKIALAVINFIKGG